MSRATFVLSATIAALVGSTAHADDSQWHVSAGPGALVVPKYPGAADSDAFPLVDVDIAYGRFFLNWWHGIGAYLIDDGRRQLGASLWFRRGRDRNDSDRVATLEPIDMAPAAHAFYSEHIGSLALSASVTQTLAKGGGVSADGSVAWQFQPYRPAHVQVGIRATVGDPRYMRTWFGITAGQARASGLAEYDVDPGLASVGGFAVVSYQLSPDWVATAYAGCDVLVGDASDSPVVERATMPMFAVSLQRRFGNR
ncbi:MAG TPA: MipA/OmpV family protein [Steroidobacteraceae bacterium]|jgi:outer membrane scaffolding protein for murein synthesis (MipA/OmpV family)